MADFSGNHDWQWDAVREDQAAATTSANLASAKPARWIGGVPAGQALGQNFPELAAHPRYPADTSLPESAASSSWQYSAISPSDPWSLAPSSSAHLARRLPASMMAPIPQRYPVYHQPINDTLSNMPHRDSGFGDYTATSDFLSPSYPHSQEQHYIPQYPLEEPIYLSSSDQQVTSFPSYSGYSTSHPQASYIPDPLAIGNLSSISSGTMQPALPYYEDTSQEQYHQQNLYYQQHPDPLPDKQYSSPPNTIDAGSPSYNHYLAQNAALRKAPPPSLFTPDVLQTMLVSRSQSYLPPAPQPATVYQQPAHQASFQPSSSNAGTTWSAGDSIATTSYSPSIAHFGHADLQLEHLSSVSHDQIPPAVSLPGSSHSSSDHLESLRSSPSSSLQPAALPTTPVVSETIQHVGLSEPFHDGNPFLEQLQLDESLSIPKSTVNSRKAGKREHRRHDATCSNCHTTFGIVFLRGYPEDFLEPFGLHYTCSNCAGNNQSASEGPDGGASAMMRKTSSGGVKKDQLYRKRLRTNDPHGSVTCDVCMRTIGQGGPVPIDGKSELTFNIELVCCRCDDRYARCSDCGGGGGVRLGVGRWRCRELFQPGRKTCSLNHSRQPNVASMQYSVTRCSAITTDEMPEVSKQCKKVFESALYSSLAVPEILEPGTAASATTFQDVIKRVEGGWKEARLNVEEDVEETKGYRRYLGLRWAAPKPRKTPAKKVVQAGQEPLTSAGDSSSVIRPGMVLSGYVSGEWDIAGGTFYISVSVPYSTGEQYEGSAHLIAMMTQRIMEDRKAMVQDLQLQGRLEEAGRIPPVLHTFTMLFFTAESKLVSFLESKRHLIPLNRYLAQYPDTPAHIFPPFRRVAPHIEQQPGWQCLVRRNVAVTNALPAQPKKRRPVRAQQ